MGLNVSLLNLNGIAFDSQDISMGEAESVSVKRNNRGQVSTVNLKRRSVTLTARGITAGQVAQFSATASNAKRQLLSGSRVGGSSIHISGYIIQNAVLTSVTPSGFIIVDGVELVENVQLIYESLVFL